MSATTDPQTNPASSRRLIGAALGLVLVVAAAPFLRTAMAAQPAGDAAAAVETAGVGQNATTTDPAIWVNPQDAARSLILGANGKGGLGVYDLAGLEQTQTGATSAPVTGVDTRNGIVRGGSPVSVATAVGEGGVKHGLMHF
ncbi:MAG: phytase, partial [Acidimicrobiia bacterium]